MQLVYAKILSLMLKEWNTGNIMKNTKFRLLREGIIDGVLTTQDITNHPQQYEWTNAKRWHPLTSHFCPTYILKCVYEDTDGEIFVTHIPVTYEFNEWRTESADPKGNHVFDCTRFTNVYWKLI